jgi:hypothetical protein
MKILPLAILALATIGASAEAAPQLAGTIVAEQIANGPAAPDQGEDKNATAPNALSSKKLSESKGVIHPPPTGDRSVIAPPPTVKTNKTVISPPGTPGGDPSIQPK